MVSKIIFGAGAKGGTGKSTFLRFVVTWLQENGVEPHLIDADDENGTLKRFFPQAVTVQPSRRKSYDVLINIAESGKHPLTVVDVKAGVGFDMLAWFEDVPFEELAFLDVRLVCVGVITSSPDSVSSFLRWVDRLGKNVKYVVGLNLKDSDAWEQKPEEVLLPEYHRTKQGLEFRKIYKPAEIILPALDPEYQGELERMNLTIRDVLARHPKTPPTLSPLIVRAKLRNYQTKLYDAFAANKEVFLP